MHAFEALIPVTMFLVLGAVFALFFWFRYRMRNDMQQTIRTAIEKGQELSPEIIDRLGSRKPHPDSDLRKAVIWIGGAAGLAVFGIAMGVYEADVRQVMLGVAAFPFFIGLAYAVLWRFGSRDA
ncbi:MAG: DUF6249 domain-containing protein [Woeseiaceae bacterium]|nr:DUF6249 domain-containing protein [Woeseiaceae bacterium]